MYVKIFSQIYDSSIVEKPEVRFTFMDLLVLADRDGVVDITHEAIARRTNRPLQVIIDTIAELEAPDTNSRTSDADGRRLKRLDEHRKWGWVIVNYDLFRGIANEEQRREKTKERVRRYRQKVREKPEKRGCNAGVTQGNAPKRKKRHTEADTEADTTTNATTNATSAALTPKSSTLSRLQLGFDEFWKVYPRKQGKGAAKRSWSKIKPSKELTEKILMAVEQQKQLDQWLKDGGQYIPCPATWLNQERWFDEVQVVQSGIPPAREGVRISEVR